MSTNIKPVAPWRLTEHGAGFDLWNDAAQGGFHIMFRKHAYGSGRGERKRYYVGDAERAAIEKFAALPKLEEELAAARAQALADRSFQSENSKLAAENRRLREALREANRHIPVDDRAGWEAINDLLAELGEG